MKGSPRKVRKFAEGGFSDAQEEWLTRGGQSPDRTDPYILARMRSAVPDTPEKNNYVPNKDSAMDNRDVGRDVGSDKVENETKTYSYPDSSLVKEPPIIGGKTKAPVVKEKIKTTTVVASPKVKDDSMDEGARRAQNRAASIEGQNNDINVRRRVLEKVDKPLEESHPEDYIPGAGTLSGLLRKGLRNLGSKFAKDVTPKPDQIGMDARRIGMDARRQIGMNPRQIGMNPRKQLELDKSGQSNRASSSGAMKDDFKPGDLRSDFKKGGKIKKMASGGKVSSASKRADGCAIRGKTRA